MVRLFKSRMCLPYMYWISLTEVLEKVPMRESERYGQFRAIDIKHCITIGWEDGLEKLFRF